MLEFTGSPALIFKKYLILSDIHLGIEKELLQKGINVPPQTDKVINRIIALAEEFNIKSLIVLGDFKHNVPKISYTELIEVPKALKVLSENFRKIYITKGNHDGKLEELIPEDVKNVKIVRALRRNKLCMTHGHLKPKEGCKFYIIGHNHPVLGIKTSIGETIYEKVFVHGFTDEYEVLILPAFGILVGGYEPKEFNGPIAKKIKEFSILSLEGVYIK